MAIGGRIDWDEAALRDLLQSPTGPVARDLAAKAERVTQEAKRLAPVSPKGSNGRPSGWLRSQIGFTVGVDALGVYADIASPAETPTGEPYGLFQEVGTSKMAAQPHLRPALFIIKGT
jgi:hypothetical protein